MAPAPRHFLDLHEIDGGTLRALLDEAHRRKAARTGWTAGRVDADAPAAGRTLAMIFEKNSTRTRFSFDAAMRQLGGAAIVSNVADMQLGRGEPIGDTARVLSRMVDAVMIRADRHADVAAFAAASAVPVVNGLTDRSHPCQVMADLMTLEERRGPVERLTLAWVGDGNNVCASVMQAAARLGFRLRVSSPAPYGPDAEDIRLAGEGAPIAYVADPREAVAGVDAVLTDTWVSMGDHDAEARLAALKPYQVNEALMAAAGPAALFLHCLPAHRGEEVTDAVIDGPASLVFDEAENRIHAQKAILAWCFGGVC